VCYDLICSKIQIPEIWQHPDRSRNLKFYIVVMMSFKNCKDLRIQLFSGFRLIYIMSCYCGIFRIGQENYDKLTKICNYV
jgi:hypothetical protein